MRGRTLARARALYERPDGTRVARYRFTHGLYASVLVERVSAARRLRLHQRLGDWLERTYGTHVGAIEGKIAHHFAEAHDHARAIVHLRRSAECVRHWAHRAAAARRGAKRDVRRGQSTPDVPVYPRAEVHCT